MSGKLAKLGLLAGAGMALTLAFGAAGPAAAQTTPAQPAQTAPGAVLPWEARVQGMPKSFEAGGTGGYYFWIDDQGFHLWTTDPENIDSHYTGTLTTDGSFSAVSLEQPEGDDHVSGQGGGTVTFDLHTQSGIDGINFSVDGATKITLDLMRDGNKTSVDNIFLGEDSVHPAHNPLDVHQHP